MDPSTKIATLEGKRDALEMQLIVGIRGHNLTLNAMMNGVTLHAGVGHSMAAEQTEHAPVVAFAPGDLASGPFSGFLRKIGAMTFF